MTRNENLILLCLRSIVDTLDGIAYKNKKVSKRVKAKWLQEDIKRLDAAYEELRVKFTGKA